MLIENLDIIIYVSLLGLFGVILKFVLYFTGQYWASTIQHTYTFVLLPIIGFIIVKVIGENIALSLGMVGALSIVRFRNPVRSSFELVIFFGLITTGISMASNPIWGISLGVLMNSLIIVLFLFEKFLKKIGLSFSNISFQESSQKNILEIISNKKIEVSNVNILEKSENILDKNYIYIYSFDNKQALDEFYKSMEKNDDIKKINVKYLL
tara:strand:+ start:3481 stop:4110 length:630 start_codon:yes stop_codon:yes gene_type:complete